MQMMWQSQGQAEGVGRGAGISCSGSAGEIASAERMRRAQEKRAAVMRGEVGGDRVGPGEGDGRVVGEMAEVRSGTHSTELCHAAVAPWGRGALDGAACRAEREQHVQGRVLADRQSFAGNPRTTPLAAAPIAECMWQIVDLQQQWQPSVVHLALPAKPIRATVSQHPHPLTAPSWGRFDWARKNRGQMGSRRSGAAG
ncbi:unnamed protein product [Closterium sp. Naga37s-1]|nr:unnamed protein product [Closterium sp. Naga37s-1]